MAQDWCLAYGILDPDQTISLYKLSMKRRNKDLDMAALKEYQAKSSSPTRGGGAAAGKSKADKAAPRGRGGAKIIDESMEVSHALYVIAIATSTYYLSTITCSLNA